MLVALLAVAVYDLWLFISSPANRMLKLALLLVWNCDRHTTISYWRAVPYRPIDNF